MLLGSRDCLSRPVLQLRTLSETGCEHSKAIFSREANGVASAGRIVDPAPTRSPLSAGRVVVPEAPVTGAAGRTGRIEAAGAVAGSGLSGRCQKGYEAQREH